MPRSGIAGTLYDPGRFPMMQDKPWSIPDHWSWHAIGDKAQVVGGGTPSTKIAAYFDDGEIPWLTPADLSGYTEKYIQRGRRNITDEGLNSSSARLMPAGTVLFSSRAPIGYVAIAANPVTTNQGFKSFVPDADVDSVYLYYYLQRGRELAVQLASGTTFPEISGKNAKRIPLPLPPLDEQQEIVEAIETQFTRLDDAVAALERARVRLRRYRASVLKSACEGTLVPTEADLARQEGRDYEPASVLLERIRVEREAVPARRRGQRAPAPVDASELPGLPEGWAATTVESIAHVGTGATPLRSNSTFYEGGIIPWVTSGALNNETVEQATEYVTEVALEQTNLTLYPSGTLLVAMYGEGKTRGKTSELMIEATTNQAIAAIVLSGAAQPLKGMVKLFLHSQYEDMRRVASGGVQPNLNLSIIRRITLPIPPLAEQERIVEEVERRLSVIEQMEATVEANLKRAESLRQSILRLAFSGRLVTSMAEVVV